MDQEDAAHDLDHELVALVQAAGEDEVAEEGAHVQPAGEEEGADAHDQEPEQVAKTVRGRSYTQT
jgi:hypothetical protein